MSHDSELQSAVLAELEWEPSVTAAHIGVTASGGVVTLTGHVESFAQRYAAQNAASRVKGVKAVAENIKVELPFDKKREDDEIAAAAIDRLSWSVSVPQDAIKIVVEKGWVTMQGQVDWFYQKEAAEDDIRALAGVTGVSNQIVIKPRVNVKDISDNIAHALHRTWFFEPKAIKVTEDKGMVHLSGTVRTWNDKQVASAIAWSAPGATAVDNSITII